MYMRMCVCIDIPGRGIDDGEGNEIVVQIGGEARRREHRRGVSVEGFGGHC